MSVEDDRKLFVAGLADAVTEDILRQLFEAAGGEVQSVTIPVDRATGRPRGFAFVTMGSADQAGAVRQALDGTLQAGRSMSVRLFRADRNSTPPSRGQVYQPEESTLYVGNLPFDSSAAELEEALRAAGGHGNSTHSPADRRRRTLSRFRVRRVGRRGRGQPGDGQLAASGDSRASVVGQCCSGARHATRWTGGRSATSESGFGSTAIPSAAVVSQSGDFQRNAAIGAARFSSSRAAQVRQPAAIVSDGSSGALGQGQG